MSEHQEASLGIEEEVVAEGAAAEEALVLEAAPSAAAQRAAETHEEVVEVRQEGLSRTLDNLRSQVITLNSLKEKTGKLNFEKVQELAAIIPVEVLYQIEDVRPGSLLELFAEKTGSNNYSFSFADQRGQLNPQAESLIGLNYFFKHKPEIRRLKVISADGKEEIGDRGESLKGSFYQGDEYVEVMAGYRVEILETLKPNGPKMRQMERKREKATKAYETVQGEPDRFSSFTTMLRNGKYDHVDTTHLEGATQEQRLTREIIERSADAGVDPYLVMSLLQAENGNNGYHFGVKMGDESANFESQLDWALKIIAQREQAFTQNGGKLKKNGHYTEEFLAYFSESYSPSAENPNHFENLYQNYARYCGFKPAKTEKLAEARQAALKKPTPKQIEISKNNGKYTIETVIPDEAYRQEVQTYLSRFNGGDRVAEAARILSDKSHPLYKKGSWNTGEHCWDWVNKAYTVAGFHWYKQGQKIQHYHYSHPDKKLGEYARRQDLYKLQPGDWLYLNVSSVNKAWGGRAGDHSVIFLRWIDKENLIAECAGNPRPNSHAKIKTTHLAGDDKVGRHGTRSYYPVIYRSSPGTGSSY